MFLSKILNQKSHRAHREDHNKTSKLKSENTVLQPADPPFLNHDWRKQTNKQTDRRTNKQTGWQRWKMGNLCSFRLTLLRSKWRAINATNVETVTGAELYLKVTVYIGPARHFHFSAWIKSKAVNPVCTSGILPSLFLDCFSFTKQHLGSQLLIVHKILKVWNKAGPKMAIEGGGRGE